MDSFICANCGNEFTLAPSIRARYPTWVPKCCTDCHGGPRRQGSASVALNREETLNRYQDGPQTGIFTDGFCEPNPGRGGWGAVKVSVGQIIEERHGREEDTTNNRMELKALIEGYQMVQVGEGMAVFSDSQYCVNVVTTWAASWKKNGWTRGKQKEEIKNLDLVMELHELATLRPSAKAAWIKGHAGNRWNEYADALAREDAS
jgi:ribonuclease HI